MIMTANRRNRIIAAASTLIVHVAVLYILLSIVLKSPPASLDIESGVFVQIGNIDAASGTFEPYSSSVEQVLSIEASDDAQADVDADPDTEDILEQNTEESVTIEQKREEEERRRAEEVRKQKEEEQKLAEQREKTSRVNIAMQNAFGADTGQSESRDADVQGVSSGNANFGATQGADGWGRFSLAGRKCLSLPKPSYDSNVEGTVVVEITVNKTGQVITANVKAGSSTNESLRKAAISAARKALFDKSDKSINQVGTITYYFKQQ